MGASMSAVDKSAGSSLKVLNPVAIREFKPISPAKRLKDLKNKKIGLYWNFKARGDIALERVKELLSERFEGVSFEWFKTGPVNEGTEEWFQSVLQSGVDGVVATTGD